MGNYNEIIEYQQRIDSSVTKSKKEIEPLITILDPANLVSKARVFLRGAIESLGFETKVFYRIVEVDREPKFVIDILIRIPEFNRNKKFAVLSVIGDLMRAYPNLLFDFRTARQEEIPEGFSVI
jgi:hypothetical protein